MENVRAENPAYALTYTHLYVDQITRHTAINAWLHVGKLFVLYLT
jgi:hypothetical protein